MPFFNASQIVFSGVQILLDEQTPAERRPAAVVRIREYAGLEPGYTALTEILKQRVKEQMAKPGVVYPARVEIETEMARNSNYLDGIADADGEVQADRMAGAVCHAEEAAGRLRRVGARRRCCPRRAPISACRPKQYALELESYGIDIPPDQLAAMAHQAFIEIQGEMKADRGADCRRSASCRRATIAT